ncbi:MAG: DUF4112 domain-containing protein [Longimicrobiaceae bacterium]
MANELARDEKREAAIRRVDALAHLLDNSIPVPGTGMRFGLDALIGLVPGFGDAAGALLSSWIVLEGARLGAGFTVVVRMLLNVAIEAVVGAIPLLGDLFDAGWKANVRNIRLLHQAIDAPGATRRSSTAFVLLVFLVLAALFAGTLFLAWLAFSAAAELAGGGTVRM